MLKKLKTVTLQMIGGANIATIVTMWLVGYSDRLNPASHPILSTAGLVFPVFLLINLGFLIFWIFFYLFVDCFEYFFSHFCSSCICECNY